LFQYLPNAYIYFSSYSTTILPDPNTVAVLTKLRPVAFANKTNNPKLPGITGKVRPVAATLADVPMATAPLKGGASGNCEPGTRVRVVGVRGLAVNRDVQMVKLDPTKARAMDTKA
jgi:hypothetical protein